MAENEMQMMQQLDALPAALKYGAKQLQVRVNRTTNILPISVDSVAGDGSSSVRFRFPSASIINLSSATVSFRTTISGLVTGSTNFVNALIPASYKYVRRVQFFLGGISVAGSLSNAYNQVYHAMLKSTASKPYCHTKVIESYTEVSDLYDQFGYLNQPPAATSKVAYQQLDDFLLLARGNGGSSEMMIDTSIWNDLEMQLDFDNSSILSICADGTGNPAGVSWALSNLRLNVDVISSIPPIYASVLEVRAASAFPIRLAYQNFVSQIQLVQPTTRIQVSSTCIDGLMVCALASNYNSTVAFASNVAANTSIDCTNPPKFDFVSGLTNDTAQNGFSASLQVGTALYPTTPYNTAFLLADSTLNHFWSNSVSARSLLYQQELLQNNSVAGSQAIVSGRYVATNYLNNQFIWVQSFSLCDGWSDPNKILSGIDTSATNAEILVITSGIANGSQNFLMVGLLTSVLEYDTVSRRVRVIQ